MTTSPRISIETLLAETEGLRRLAASLVADAASADDLVQEAVLAALSNGPAVHKNPGGWLRSTVRNLARQGHRSRAHAAARERDVAPPEAALSAVESMMAVERQRVLLEAIMELGEPSREAVLARHLRGLSPRAIAEECGAPVSTVKKRIERGLTELRKSLGKRYGEGGAWAVALLPLCRPEVRGLMAKAAVSGTAGAAVESGSKLSGSILFGGAAAAVLAALGGMAWYIDRHEPVEEPLPLSQARLDPTTVASGQTLEAPASEPATARVAPVKTGEAGSHGESTALAEPVEVATRAASGETVTLLGLDGEPIRHAKVQWKRAKAPGSGGSAEERQQEGRTDEGGRLSFTRWDSGELREVDWAIDGRQFAPIGSRQSIQRSRELLMAQAIRFAGRVVDGNGDAVAGAQVRCYSEPALYLRLPEEVRHAGFQDEGRNVTSGPDGSFDLGFVPAAGLAAVKAYAGKASSAQVDTPVSGDLGVVLTVGRQSVKRGLLRGRVEHVDGTACPGATVRFEYHEAEADADGRFEIGVPRVEADEPPRITAQDGNGNFGLVEGSTLRLALEDSGLEMRIVVPDAMGTVRGRLLHPDGSAAPNVYMVLLDGTPKGSSSAKLESIRSAFGEQTDAEGRFEISLLRDRPYTLRFYSFEPLMVHDARIDPLAAGPWTLTLSEEPEVRSAEGIVVNRREEPVVGARVAVSVALDTAYEVATGRPDVAGLSMTTDQKGHFLFPSLPGQGIKIGVATEEISGNLAASFPISSFEPGEAKRIEVDPLCEVNLSVADEEVRAIGARDASGKNLTLLSRVAGSSTHAWTIARGEDGEFPLLFMPLSTEELVFRSGSRELRSEPVRLERGKVNRLGL